MKHAKSIWLKLIVMIELPNIFYQLYLEFQKIKPVLMELLHRIELRLLETFNKFGEFEMLLYLSRQTSKGTANYFE